MEFHRQLHPPAPLAIPFTLRERSYSCKSAMECCRPHMHETQVKPHLQCGNRSAHDPNMIRPHTRPSRTRRTAEVDPSRFGDGLCMEKHRVCVHLLSLKNAFRARLPSMELHRQLLHQHHLQCHLHCRNDPTVANHNGIPSANIGNSSTSTTCNPIYIAGTILQLQITMEFCRPHMHETQVKPHLQCGTDPNMIRP